MSFPASNALSDVSKLGHIRNALKEYEKYKKVLELCEFIFKL
jgi:hypothetical protein